jgi:hypothetical protein
MILFANGSTRISKPFPQLAPDAASREDLHCAGARFGGQSTTAGASGGHMKTIIAVLAVFAGSVVPAWANMCIHQREIVSTHSDDGRNLTFRMVDGRILVNHLQGICSDLRFEGFVWSVPGTEDICENQQSLQVINSGQVCVLGKFDLVKDKPVTH